MELQSDKRLSYCQAVSMSFSFAPLPTILLQLLFCSNHDKCKTQFAGHILLCYKLTIEGQLCIPFSLVILHFQDKKIQKGNSFQPDQNIRQSANVLYIVKNMTLSIIYIPNFEPLEYFVRSV